MDDKHPVLTKWLDLLKDEPDRVPKVVPTLYHYTDAVGLFGIISSHTLWASAAQFSNDLAEIEYALLTAREVIDELWPSRDGLGGWEQILLEHVQQFFGSPFPDFNQPFVVSFCEDGNLLSQWRAYGHRSGFSLGFKLRDVDENDFVRCEIGMRTLLRRVIYESSVQKARLRFLLEKFRALVNQFTEKISSEKGNEQHVELSLLLMLELTEWAATVKHSAFSEEREWRLISFPHLGPEKVAEIKIRATSELLIPYMVLKAINGTLLPLVNAQCGPSAIQRESVRAVRMLLTKEGYGSLPIGSSEIPLRV